MPTPTFAQQMLTKIEALLLANPGVQSVNVDGVNVQFTDLLKQREHWAKKVAQETGRLPLFQQVDLGGES